MRSVTGEWRPALRVLALSSALVAGAARARAAAPARWQVSGAAASGTPAVLPQGLSLGATAEAVRRLGARSSFVSARLGWSAATAANTAWIIDHHQFVAAIGIGLSATLGAGRIWAQAGAGASSLYEILSRHQRERIEAALVPGAAETSLTLGPYAFGELGVGVQMRGAVSGFVAAGPTICRTSVGGEPLWRYGGSARLGVAYDF
jgi:hypothetical protein